MSSDSQVTGATQAPQQWQRVFPMSKKPPWYKPSTDLNLSLVGRQVLEEYSHIPPAEIESHICHVRDLAWEIFPWPCIGRFSFVSFVLSRHPQYSSLVSHLSRAVEGAPPKLLDLGTCMGQDLRKLLFDGVPIDRLFGSDIFSQYESIGHELFRDRDTFHNRFIPGDLFDKSPDHAIEVTKGNWEVIVIVMFLHIFDWNDQLRAAERIIDLLSSKPGSMIIGAQTATIKPGEQALFPPFVQPGEHKSVYRQSRETFTQMWEEVGKSRGVKLNIWAEYEAVTPEKGTEGIQEKKFLTGDEQRRLYFTVKRV